MKIFGIVILSFLLFILLTIFGFVFSVQQIALSPGFITGVINDIDFSDAARDALEQEDLTIDEDISQELVDAIIDTLDEIEPVLKEKVNIAVRDTYDYLLGKANAPGLKEILGDSFMNAQFVESVLEKIDISRIVDEATQEQVSSGNETEEVLQESLLAAIDKLEPTIAKHVAAACDPIFKYLLSQTQTINLKNVLRQNILDKEFTTELINALDIKSIAKDTVSDQLDMVLPQGIELNSSEIDQIIAVAEPAIKTGLISAVDPIADYLLGIRPSFSITISWDAASASAKSIVKQAYLRQLPPELAKATPAQIDQAYEIYWASAQSSIPTNFDIDSSMLGDDLSQSIEEALTSAQDGLAEARDGIDEATTEMAEGLDKARPYIRIFQLAYWGLILLILLTIGGIILIHRSVKGATRDLSINFLVYGAFGLGVMLILRNTIGRPAFIRRFVEGDIPDYVWNTISPVIQRLTQPLFIFTLACTIIGVALLVVSFVYPKREPVEPIVETSQPPPQST
ncbi:MAG TPA: hypothetical protein VGA85_05845 [Dehalococcoidales bacterium]